MSTAIVSTGATLTVTNGTLALSGDSTVGNGALLDGAGQVDSGLYALINDGTIAADDATGPLTLDPASLDNEGTIIALTNSLTIAPGVSVVNFNGTELSGGSWGAGQFQTLTLPTAPIVIDAATIDLTGASATIRSVSNGVTTALGNSLTEIAATGVLNLTHTGYIVRGPLTDDGTIDLTAAANVDVALNGTLNGNGTISGSGYLDNLGLVSAAPGDALSIGSGVSIENFTNGTLTGGTWAAFNGGTLILPTGSIVTDKATIDLSGTGAAILSVSNGTTTALQNTLTLIKGSGVLNLTDTTYTVGNSLAVLGTIGLTNATLTVAAAGTLEASGTIAGSGVLDNKGLVVSSDVYYKPVIQSGVSIANFANGTLTGGTWAVSNGGLLLLPTGPIVTDTATLDLSGTISAIYSVSNGATTDIQKSLTDIAAGGSLFLQSTTYTARGSLTVAGTVTLDSAVLQANSGNVTVAAGGLMTGTGTIAETGTIAGTDTLNVAASGIVDNSVAGGTLTIDPATLNNLGQIAAFGGDVVVGPGVTVTQYTGGTLTGGGWSAGLGGTLTLDTAPITVDDASISLGDPGSAIITQHNGTTTAIQNSLTDIAQSGVLDVTGMDYSAGGPLSDEGVIDLSNGTLSTPFGTMSISANGTLYGSGTVTAGGALSNAGEINANAAGGLTIASGAKIMNLSHGTLTGGTWAATNGDTLVLANGPIATDDATIDLAGTGAAILSVSNGTTTALQNSLTDIAATGILNLTDTTYTVSGSLDVLGTIGLRNSTLTVAAAGTLDAGGTVAGSGVLDNKGLVVSTNALNTPSIQSGVSIANFANGTLTGGTWAAFNGGTLILPTGSIVTDDATIDLAGAGAEILTASNGATTAIQNSLTDIAKLGVLTVSGTDYRAAGSLSDEGVIDLSNGTLSTPVSPLSISANGVLYGSGTVTAGGALSNAGEINANAAGGLTIASGASITNLSHGTLTGGTWAATNGDTLVLANGTIATDGGTIDLTGTGAAILSVSNGATAAIQNSLTDIASTGVLNLTDKAYTVSSPLTDDGTVNLANGTLSVAATGKLSGSGVITGNGTLSNAGDVVVEPGSSLVIGSGVAIANFSNGTLTGGTWDADQGARLFLPTGSITTNDATIDLAGPGAGMFTTSNGTVDIQDSLTDIGTVGLLSLRDTKYLVATSLTNNGTIVITGGTLAVDKNNTLSGSGTVTGQGTLSNIGTVSAAPGDALTIGSDVSIANFANGTLTGGTWAAFNGGTLILPTGSIVTDVATIDLSGSGAAILSVSNGATDSILNTLTDIAVGGVLNLANGGYTWTGSSLLHVEGAIALNAASFTAGTGDINVSPGGVVEGTGHIGTSGSLSVISGTIQSTLTGGTLTIDGGTLTNNGDISALGGVLDIRSGVSLTNFSNGTLNGGIWSAGNGGTLVLSTPSIGTDSAEIFLAGPGSPLVTTSNGTTTAIQNSLTDIAAGGLLSLENMTYTAGGSLTVAGRLDDVNATFQGSTDGVTIATGGVLNGAGTIAGAGTLTNDGLVDSDIGNALTIAPSGGISNFSGGVLSGGTWQAKSNSALVLTGGPLVTDDAMIALEGFNAKIDTLSNGTEVGLGDSLTDITDMLSLTDGASFLSGTSLTDNGRIELYNGTISVSAAGMTVGANGTLHGQGGITGTGALTNNGTVSVGAFNRMAIAAGVTITNYQSGTLTNGAWVAGTNGTLTLATGAIVTDDAMIALQGPGAAIITRQAALTPPPENIQDSLADIAGAGTLALQDTTYTAGGTLTVDGTVTLSNGTLVASSKGLTVDAGGTLAGTGDITGGPLSIDGGTILANVTGGQLTINTATLETSSAILANGGSLLIAPGVGIANSAAGTLTNGVWGASNNGTLTISTGKIVTDAAQITLDGAGAAIVTQSNGTTTAIQNSLTDVAYGGSLALRNRAYQAGGSLSDEGGISLVSGTLSALSGAVSIGVGGFLDGAGTVISGGPLSNAGGITADQPGTLSIASGGSITNLSNGTLTGGEWSAFKNSTLLLSGGSITTDNAYIALSGPGGALVTQSNGAATPVDIQNSLTDIAVAGILNVSGMTYTPGGPLSVAGLLRLTQGILQDAAGGLDLAATGAVEGNGTITVGTLTVGGTILADNGTLTVASGLSTAQYNNGTLTGGTWGASSAGTLALSTGPIRTDEAVISLSDQGSAIVTQSNGTTTALQNSLTDIGTAGQLILTNTTYTAGGSLTVEGQVQLDNATLQGAHSGVTVAATGGFFGVGQDTITGGTLTVLGVVQSDSGTLTIESGLLNNQGWMGAKGGNLAIASGVSIANVSNGTLTGGLWAAGHGTLTLGAAPIVTDDADIELNGTGVVVTGGGASGQNIQNTLTEIGTAGTLGLTDATFTSGQALTDDGAISLNNGTVSTAKLLTVGGIGAVHGSGTLTGTGTLTNEGVVSSDVGGTLTVGAGATITNFSNGTLTGGVWAATGASALVLTTDSIVTDDATLSLNGMGSAIYTQANGTAPLVNIDTSLTEVATAGALDLTNTSFTADNSLTVDGTVSLRNGTLDVIPTPSLVSGYDDVTIAAGGTIMGYGTLNTGLSVDDAGLIEASGGTLAISDGPSIDGAGTLAADATGTLLLGPDGGSYTQTIVNDGIVAVRSDPASQVHASTTIDGAYSGTGSVLIQGLTPGQGQTGLSLAGTISANVAFDANAGELEIQDPATYAGTISGFWDPDTIVLDGIDATAATLSGGVLSLSDNGTVVDILSLNTASVDYSSVTFSIVDKPGVSTTVQVSGAQQAPCYREGTRIATADGEVPVESLKPGDIVLTLFSGPVPVVWAGRRRVDCARHPDPDKVLPILVKTHAFARGIPHSDLYLSPDHAVYVDDVLIPIHHLVNGRTIRQVVVEHVTYFHIELAEHDILLAEGLTAESYLENGDRQCFDNAGGVLRLHPEFGARRWETAGCAPLVITGPALRTVRERLARRAKDKRRRPSAA